MEITLEGFLVINWYISTPYLANSNMAALQKAGFAVTSPEIKSKNIHSGVGHNWFLKVSQLILIRIVV